MKGNLRRSVFLLLFMSILPLQASSDEWLKEVGLLIAPVEKDRYLALRKRPDRERLQEIFWMRRDPTPTTPLNEFRIVFEEQRRQALARAAAGSRQAEIMTMLGVPQEKEEENGRSVWHYQKTPFYSPIKTPFALYWQNGELDRSRCTPELISFIDDFRNATLFQPVYVVNPRFLPTALFDPEDHRHRVLMELADGSRTPGDFPSAFFQAGTEGQPTHLGLVFKTADSTDESYAVFLLRNRDFPAIEYLLPMQLKPFQSFAGNNYFAWGQAVVPGIYDLYAAVFPSRAQEPWLIRREMEVRKFRPGVFTLGTVLTAVEELPVTSSTIHAYSPYHVSDRVFIPLLESRVKADGRLFLLIPVYHPDVENGSVRLQASYHFKGRDDEFTVDSSLLSSSLAEDQTVLTLATELPLAELENGQWILELEIRDLVSGKRASQIIVFEVE